MKAPLALSPSFALASSLWWLLVSLQFAAAISATTKKPPPQALNLNAATSEQLQLVPGTGPATANKILLMRKSYAPFKSVDDLLAIRSIGKKRLDKIRKSLVAGKSSSSAKPLVGNSAQPGAAGEPIACVGYAPTACWGAATKQVA
jgi:competence ComEA-like helix-hairpin-helix protein